MIGVAWHFIFGHCDCWFSLTGVVLATMSWSELFFFLCPFLLLGLDTCSSQLSVPNFVHDPASFV